MNKRQWLLVAGTLAVAACGNYAGVCQTAGYSANENHNRDQIDQVECSEVNREPASAPAPRVQP